MTIKLKAVLVVLTAFVMYVAMTYAVAWLVIYPEFETLEKSEAVEDVERVTQAIDAEIEHLRTICHDWAAWDDTYDFVESRSNDYAKTNLLDETFKDIGLNLIYICDTDGNVVWGKVLDIDFSSPVEILKLPHDKLPSDSPLIAFEKPGESVAGIMPTRHMPLLIASEPIITSENKGPVRGAFIMGVFIDDAYADLLKKQTKVDFSLVNLHDVKEPPIPEDAKWFSVNGSTYRVQSLSRDSLVIYSVVNGISGDPALLVSAKVPRYITKSGASVLRFAFLSVIAVGMLMLLVLSLHIGSVIIVPLIDFTKHIVAIRDTGDLMSLTQLKRRDEIGTLSREFDYMLSQLRETRKRLSEQSYRAGIADITVGLLHTLRNVLTPLAQSIHEIQSGLSALPLEKAESALAELKDPAIDDARRDDLIKYTTLALAKSASSVEKAKKATQTLSERTLELEKTLAQHESLTRIERHLENVAIAEIVKDAIALIPERLTKVANIKYTEDTGVPRGIPLDRLVILHVLVNLILNALESIERAKTPMGVVSVAASVATELDARSLRLLVGDNGEGIEAADLKRVFERGFSSKGDIRGGFGLHWCANAVTHYGGAIYAESDGKGRGAAFKVILPIDKGAIMG